MKDRRNSIDKLNTLLFGKDLRITKGEPYTEVRPFDFSSYYPEENYIKPQKPPKKNVFDIRDFGANVNLTDNTEAVNKAVNAASEKKGVVLISGGDYVTKTVFLKSNVTLFIEKGSALCADKTGEGYNHMGILHADGAENIVLTGGGKVKGNG
ncbi:MAG: hypothetical protein IJT65_00640, partial [Eubacterium sp.]|nr:hypothetical protein [Eubacterium sp.]